MKTNLKIFYVIYSLLFLDNSSYAMRIHSVSCPYDTLAPFYQESLTLLDQCEELAGSIENLKIKNNKSELYKGMNHYYWVSIKDLYNKAVDNCVRASYRETPQLAFFTGEIKRLLHGQHLNLQNYIEYYNSLTHTKVTKEN